MKKLEMTPSKDLIGHLSRIHECEKSDFRWHSLRSLVKRYVYGKSVLDVGCGTGHVSLDLLQMGFEVASIDRSQEMVDFTKEIITEAGYDGEVYLLDVLNSKCLDKDRFDFIVCLDVIEHIKQDNLALKNMNYLLKTHGGIIIIVPAIKYLYGVRDRNIGHHRRYGKKELANKLNESGFEIIEMRYWNFLGLVPFFISEKLLHRSINENIRYSRNSMHSKALNAVLDKWFCLLENNVKFPIGLSLLVVAKKKEGYSYES